MGVWPSFGLILAVFFAGQIPVLIGFQISDHGSYDNVDTHGRYDAGIYLEIAQDGYRLGPCPIGENNRSPNDWCGTAGWLPAYPAVMRAIHATTGVAHATAGVAVSITAHLGLLVLVWFVALDRRRSLRSVAALTLAGLFPALMYQSFIFPITSCALFLVAFALLAAKRRLVLAGICGAAAVLTYTLAIIVIPVACIWLATEAFRAPARVRWRRLMSDAVRLLGPIVAGLASMLAYFQVRLGHWDATLLIQSSYNHERTWPTIALWSRATRIWSDETTAFVPTDDFQWPSVELLLLTVITVSLVAGALRAWPKLSSLERLLVPYAALFFLIPLSLDASMYRAAGLLAPVAILARHLKPAVVFTMAAGSAAVAIPMATLYADFHLF